MGIEIPSDYSLWKEAALVTSLLINCLNLIGFVSIGWAVPIREHDPTFEGLGLWKYCFFNSDHTVSCTNTVDLDMPSWFKGTQAMSAISFSLMVLTFLTIVVSECIKKLRRNRTTVIVFTIMALSASFTGLISVIIFGASVDDHPINLPGEEPNTYFKVSWSFIVCSIASLAHSICGFFGIVEYIYAATNKNTDTSTSTTRLDQSFSPYTSFPEFPESPSSTAMPVDLVSDLS